MQTFSLPTRYKNLADNISSRLQPCNNIKTRLVRVPNGRPKATQNSSKQMLSVTVIDYIKTSLYRHISLSFSEIYVYRNSLHLTLFAMLAKKVGVGNKQSPVRDAYEASSLLLYGCLYGCENCMGLQQVNKRPYWN